MRPNIKSTDWLPMELNDIICKIEESELTPVKTIFYIENVNDGDIFIEENIDEFIKCVKALNIQVIFVYAAEFEENQFFYKSDEILYNNSENIDLTLFDASLNLYRRYIGEHCHYELASAMGNRMIRTSIDVDWWNNFYEIRCKVMDKIKKREDENAYKMEKQREEETERHKKFFTNISARLDELADEEEFCAYVLKGKQTLKNIIGYASIRIPELGQVHSTTLKSLIGDLAAKIRGRNEFKNSKK